MDRSVTVSGFVLRCALAATVWLPAACVLVPGAHASGSSTGGGESLARLFRLRERVRPPAYEAPRSAFAGRGQLAVHTRSRSRAAVRHTPARTCFGREIEGAIITASHRYRVDADLIRAVISVESAGNPRAVSSKGARGLMQVMPATGRDLGVHDPVLLFDVRSNVTAGTRYLRYTYDRFGNWPDALAAYNAGPGAIARGRMPIETRQYIRRVLARQRAYSGVRCS